VQRSLSSADREVLLLLLLLLLVLLLLWRKHAILRQRIPRHAVLEPQQRERVAANARA
jgi:hypothetical protein